MQGFVAVHVGAGSHAASDQSEFEKLCKRACAYGFSLLENDGLDSSEHLCDSLSSASSCMRATCLLENSPLTNAGVGSNLTRDMRVECDAGLMFSENMQFAGAGAMPGVKNPIQVPYEMIRRNRYDHDLPTVPPLFLCGLGAKEFAVQSSLEIVDEAVMQTPKSISNFRKCSKVLSRFEEDADSPLDTVGCIVVDKYGRTAACCSSGGILMKYSGRVGQAACFGAGCWAEDTGRWSLALSVSGCGETLIRTQFAQRCAEIILNALNCDSDSFCLADTLHRFFINDYLKSRLLARMERWKIAGVIVALVERVESDQGEMRHVSKVEFAYAHNSKTMCIGHTTSQKQRFKPRVIFSRSENESVVIGGSTFR